MPLSISPSSRTAAQWAALTAQERAGKFFIACVEDERLLLELQKLVDECIDEGVSEAEFVHRASLLLGEITDPATGRPYYDPAGREGLTDEEHIAYDRDVTNLDSSARLKLLFRTQSEIAHGVQFWLECMEPRRLAMYPAWRFVRQPGARTKREDHVEHENDVRLITDYDYWLARNSPDFGGFNNPYPPFGYNSWMRVEPVPREEAEALGLIAPGEPVTVPPELEALLAVAWEHAIDQSNTASISSLPPEAQERIIQRCENAGLTLTPTPDGKSLTARLLMDEAEEDDADVLEQILDMLEEEENLFDSIFGANPYGCNGSGHKPGCPQKGTTREGRTKPRKKKDPTRKRTHKKSVPNEHTIPLVTIKEPCNTESDMRSLLNKQRDMMSRVAKGFRVPIENEGSIAPGMNIPFYVTSKTIGECAAKVGNSVDASSHYTAAANITTLWENSVEGEIEQDKYNSPEDSKLKCVMKRYAKMRCGDDVYLVKITAKLFKDNNVLPLLYTVNTSKL